MQTYLNITFHRERSNTTLQTNIFCSSLRKYFFNQRFNISTLHWSLLRAGLS